MVDGGVSVVDAYEESNCGDCGGGGGTVDAVVM